MSHKGNNKGNDIRTARVDELNYAIWNHLRKKITHGNVEEEIRAARARACRAVTERTRPEGSHEDDYKKLTEKELEYVWLFLQNGELPKAAFPLDKDAWCTDKQRSQLRWIATECALHYCSFDDFFCTMGDGSTISGEQARVSARELWDNRRLDKAILKHLYREWINPKMHEFLLQGGHRYIGTKYPEKPYIFSWDKLKAIECADLIDRFRLMHREITERYRGENKRAAKTRGFYSN